MPELVKLVEEALVKYARPETVRAVVEALARMVAPVTASVPVAVRLPPIQVLPETVNFADGVVVPMPTLPVV